MKRILDVVLWLIKGICDLIKVFFGILMLGYIPITVIASLNALVTDDADADAFAVSLLIGVPFYIIFLVGFGVMSEASNKHKVEEFEQSMKKRQW